MLLSLIAATPLFTRFFAVFSPSHRHYYFAAATRRHAPLRRCHGFTDFVRHVLYLLPRPPAAAAAAAATSPMRHYFERSACAAACLPMFFDAAIVDTLTSCFAPRCRARLSIFSFTLLHVLPLLLDNGAFACCKHVVSPLRAMPYMLPIFIDYFAMSRYLMPCRFATLLLRH